MPEVHGLALREAGRGAWRVRGAGKALAAPLVQALAPRPTCRLASRCLPSADKSIEVMGLASASVTSRWSLSLQQRRGAERARGKPRDWCFWRAERPEAKDTLAAPPVFFLHQPKAPQT